MKIKSCFNCIYGLLNPNIGPCNHCTNKDTPPYCDWVDEDLKDSEEKENKDAYDI